MASMMASVTQKTCSIALLKAAGRVEPRGGKNSRRRHGRSRSVDASGKEVTMILEYNECHYSNRHISMKSSLVFLL